MSGAALLSRCVTLCCVVGCHSNWCAHQYHVAYSDMGGGGRKSKTLRSHPRGKGMPVLLCPSLFLPICSYSLFFHIPPLRPSICPISPAMARFGFETRGRGVVGNSLRMVFHWRGESIMPHREENTGAFLLDKASAGPTQNTLCPGCLQPTMYHAPLAQECRALIARQCL